MNTFRTSVFRALALSLALPCAAFLAGCEVGSTDSTAAVVSDNAGTIYNFAGLYMNPNNSASTNGALPLAYPATSKNRPSGTAITSLRLLQYGSALEAYDSEGLTWSGSISVINGGVASFSLRGKTTAGRDVDIAGTMAYASQQSTMDATWIESAYYGSIFARATVAPATTNSPGVNVSISPTSVTLTSSSPTQVFTASGGGTYAWSHSGSCGSITGSGSSITYTRITSGSDTLSVSSGGDSATASITCL